MSAEGKFVRWSQASTETDDFPFFIWTPNASLQATAGERPFNELGTIKTLVATKSYLVVGGEKEKQVSILEAISDGTQLVQNSRVIMQEKKGMSINAINTEYGVVHMNPNGIFLSSYFEDDKQEIQLFLLRCLQQWYSGITG